MTEAQYIIFSDSQTTEGPYPFALGPYTRDEALEKLERIRDRVPKMSTFYPPPEGVINQLTSNRWELITKHHELDPQTPRRYVLCPVRPRY